MQKRKFKLDPKFVQEVADGKRKKVLILKRHIPGENDLHLTKAQAIEMVKNRQFSITIENSI